MKSQSELWSILDLEKKCHLIEYPEFQRESSVWSLRLKQLLIDSILRGFDIASIYLVKEDEHSFQCIDGRQRLNAIFSFLGINKDDKDNGFEFRTFNEVKEDHRLDDANNYKIESSGFMKYKKIFESYKVRIVLLSDITDEDDLNLQFQRLQIAQILSGAEKLNAMVGGMRDYIFSQNGLGAAGYFAKVGTRVGRFGREQSASQTALNVVSYSTEGNFKRSRFLDMQEFFKDNFRLSPEVNNVLEDLKAKAAELENLVSDKILIKIRNRALVVSILLFYFIHSTSKEIEKEKLNELGKFLEKVLNELKKISSKPMKEEGGNWDKLQIAITQASVEKTAIEQRHAILTEEFKKFINKR